MLLSLLSFSLNCIFLQLGGAMKYKWYVIPFLVVFMSCGGMIESAFNRVSPFIYISKLGKVNLGDSYLKYKGNNNLLKTEVKLDTLLPQDDSEGKYRILFYEYYMGDDRSLFEMLDFSGGNNYTYAAITFKNDSAIFFGFPEDYNRSYDREINMIGNQMAGLLRYLKEEL